VKQDTVKQDIHLIRKTPGPGKAAADIYGSLAVHKTIEGDYWGVTHVPTGGQLMSFRYKKHAVDLAKQLGSLADWSDVVMPCDLKSDDDLGGLKSWQKKAVLKLLLEAMHWHAPLSAKRKDAVIT
jgi:hypothetical protein